ncbi:MAG: hypothetical protein NTW33_02060 [Methanoregula sp.]|nr:hypothetical protein [Methanoregula sp.]
MSEMNRNRFLEDRCELNTEVMASQEIQERFVNVIIAKTGWTKEELRKKDMGDIEIRLGVRPVKPSYSPTVKRGKSLNGLYEFESAGTRKFRRAEITKLIQK